MEPKKDYRRGKKARLWLSTPRKKRRQSSFYKNRASILRAKNRTFASKKCTDELSNKISSLTECREHEKSVESQPELLNLVSSPVMLEEKLQKAGNENPAVGAQTSQEQTVQVAPETPEILTPEFVHLKDGVPRIEVVPDPPEILTPEFVHLKDGLPHIEVNGNPPTASQLSSQLASNDGASTSDHTVWLSAPVKEEPYLEEWTTDPDTITTPGTSKPSDPIPQDEPNVEPADVFGIFGNYVEVQLKALDEEDAIQAQAEIQAVLLRYRMKQMDKLESCVVTETTPPVSQLNIQFVAAEQNDMVIFEYESE